jgi:RimJ/RimL family protein N-acetyltransferase
MLEPRALDGAAVITTSRLLLRPFTLADTPKIFAMSQEAGMRRWIPDQVYRDEEHAELVLRALIAFTEEPPEPRTRPYVLGIEHAGELIGHVGLSPARGSVEIGYAIEDTHQGKGFASEAVSAATQWGLTELSLPEVLGIVGAENTGSRRVLEKARFARRADETTRIVYAATRRA